MIPAVDLANSKVSFVMKSISKQGKIKGTLIKIIMRLKKLSPSPLLGRYSSSCSAQKSEGRSLWDALFKVDLK